MKVRENFVAVWNDLRLIDVPHALLDFAELLKDFLLGGQRLAVRIILERVETRGHCDQQRQVA